MRYAGQRMERVRMGRFREPRATMPFSRFEYRDGLRITGAGPFPSINPGMPDTGLPDPLGGIMTQAPDKTPNITVPTRLGRLG